MASVTASETIELITNPDGSIRAKYSFTLEDNLLDIHTAYESRHLGSGTDVDADRISRHPVQLDLKRSAEVGAGIVTLENKGNPLHFFSTFWEKTTPLWQTWLDLFKSLAYHFWSMTELLEVLPLQAPWNLISSNDKKDLGTPPFTQAQVSDFNGWMQVAVDTRITLYTYAPIIDEEGIQQ